VILIELDINSKIVAFRPQHAFILVMIREINTQEYLEV